jgi:hypothetical protein
LKVTSSSFSTSSSQPPTLDNTSTPHMCIHEIIIVSARKFSHLRSCTRSASRLGNLSGFVSPEHLAWSRGLSASQSAHHFMYISLGHGHLGPEHDTSQYALQHTSSPAPNCLQDLGCSCDDCVYVFCTEMQDYVHGVMDCLVSGIST